MNWFGTRIRLLLVIWIIPSVSLALQAAADEEDDEALLRKAGLSSDGPALLASLAKHTLTPDKRRKVEERIAQLGDDEFSVREDATRQLRAFGRLALPDLRDASKGRDAEVARRAKMLIEAIDKGPDTQLPLAVLRLLAVRKPAGAVEALLAYLPFAEDDDRAEQVRKALTAMARHDGKLDAALRRSLTDPHDKVRAMAAEALIVGGGVAGRAAVRKLLSDDALSVRLHVASALTRAGQREGVSALIDLLPLLSAEESGQAEELLYLLAEDVAPELPDDKKKRRDAWAAWWKLNAQRVDMARARADAPVGYTLLCDTSANRVYEIDRHGKQRWSIGNLRSPYDAVVLPGHRVLIAEAYDSRVSERDFTGKILWQKKVKGPVNVQRLPNGHTFIASFGGAIVEVERSGKEIYSIPNVPGDLLGAYRLRRGGIACLTWSGRCLLLDTTGKQLKQLAYGYKNMEHLTQGNIDMRANGHLLIACTGDGNQVTELDGDGKLVREWKAPKVRTASPLPNGHLLIATMGDMGVYELDRAGKIVWQHKGGHVFRARRR
jgi:HEAT repeat protein